MIKFFEMLYKVSAGIRFFFLHPRIGIVRLFEESQNFQQLKKSKKYKRLNALSLEDLNELPHGIFPEINCVSFLAGGSGPTDYLLLIILAKQFSKFDYMEIGTWRGESIRNILELANCNKAVSITYDP
jgi:hypothetical protein